MYNGKECPVCQIRLQLDQVLDAKTDIENENIFELIDRVGKLENAVYGKHLLKHKAMDIIANNDSMY